MGGKVNKITFIFRCTEKEIRKSADSIRRERHKPSTTMTDDLEPTLRSPSTGTTRPDLSDTHTQADLVSIMMNETTEPLLSNTIESVVIDRRLDWDFLTATNSDVRDCMVSFETQRIYIEFALNSH